MKGRRKRDDITFSICGHAIVPKNEVRYLGVVWDDRGSFGKHVIATINKAEVRATALNRLMPNIGVASSDKRSLLYGVVHFIVLYGAPIWYKAIHIEKCRKMLIILQRKMLLRVAAAYRTKSAASLQVITGTIPIDLVIQERCEIYGSTGRLEGDTDMGEGEKSKC